MKKEEGRRKNEEGRRQKAEGRRFFPSPSAPSPPLPLSPSPPLPPSIPPHQMLWRAIPRKALSVAKSSTEIYNAALKRLKLPRISRLKLVDWWWLTYPGDSHKNPQLSSKC
ncbi:MAG: hypothetical protein JGK26_05885 [Microcoleus sp. PH2017_27_LUM_O_A]|uniref:hypothetical protein n=1 Tax=Microcoleus sp. PH2017_27_LUM_O_A TaxID=2798837 RepID=UPI001D8BF12F|nr:hypothetical protein [Microcoleus sp. PH2017_27_LUM_O_A]MCC3459355.1 hypothetical protein [Microcoleus sp. PH2017_11_PCY_U_A]MCC3558662.1 hypothetical protein [Microcoleus sp. PH2017_27_LUM_O_A]